MKTMRLISILAAIGLAGCVPDPAGGGTTNKGLSNAVGVGSSPYAILDLQSGAVSYRTAIPDLAGNAEYRDTKMVFRRVGSGSSQVLMAVFELTQAQWVRLDPIASAPWTDVSDSVVSDTTEGDAYPAYNLLADDLSTVLAAYNPSSGVRLAIPTTAQWRTAVGASSGYAWGAQADRANLVRQAVVRETVLTGARVAAGTTQIDAGGPSEVASRSASRNGIYDLHGNVWEWVDGGTRVVGGSWFHPAALAAAEVSAGASQGLLPDVDHALIGARLVLIP